MNKALEKNIKFESAGQFFITTKILTNNGNPDMAIKLLNSYLLQGQNIQQIYHELTKAYIKKQDKLNASETLKKARAIYNQNYAQAYSSETEKQFNQLEAEINNLN